ncbi:MAG: hypothetical protein HOZ81_51620 [Streptomyces sp.]|nr:hypothetical protein [Streptomyces sp.]NUS24583.1 hypothetical protein [Streptomyces sp.]
MHDRFSCPHHSLRKTPAHLDRRADQIAPWTVHPILTAHHLPLLAALDRGTGQTVRRYEVPVPAALVR